MDATAQICTRSEHNAHPIRETNLLKQNRGPGRQQDASAQISGRQSKLLQPKEQGREGQVARECSRIRR